MPNSCSHCCILLTSFSSASLLETLHSGLTISIEKPEILSEPALSFAALFPSFSHGGTEMKTLSNLKRFGSVINDGVFFDNDTNARFGKASCALKASAGSCVEATRIAPGSPQTPSVQGHCSHQPVICQDTLKNTFKAVGAVPHAQPKISP